MCLSVCEWMGSHVGMQLCMRVLPFYTVLYRWVVAIGLRLSRNELLVLTSQVSK